MNKAILSKEVQEFITNSLDANIAKLALSKNPFPSIEWKEIINQIVSKQKSKTKLPLWFATENIYYPQSLSIEQTSSELTAKFKAELLKGNTLIDLTGGLGVDCYYFSKKISHVYHCEINEELSEIAAHNYEQLKTSSITCIAMNSSAFLKETDLLFDYIYIDPSRRSDSKGKVFMLKDCLPNVPENLNFYFEKTNQIAIKTAPLLDITAGLKELTNVKAIHVVAIANEVKELLWLLEKNYSGEIVISAHNIQPTKTDTTSFILGSDEQLSYSLPKQFIYEPNAAILKSGGVNFLCKELSLSKLQHHSHLFTTDSIIDFPGRRFHINQIVPFTKKEIKKHIQNKKMNVTTRNFPLAVEEIKKKYNITDGGSMYAFFTTSINDEKIVLLCTKLNSNE